MKSNKTFIILTVVFIAVFVGALVLYSNLSGQYAPGSLATQTDPGSTAPESHSEQTTTNTTDLESTVKTTSATTPMVPDFTVTDIDGNLVNLYDFLGKPILVNFWASWCGPCRSEMPDLQKAFETYGEDIHFLMIDLTDGSRETMDIAKDYIAQSGYTFPIYFDTTLIASSVYGAYSIPSTYFIGAEGQPIAYYAGAMSSAILQQGIDMLLSE